MTCLGNVLDRGRAAVDRYDRQNNVHSFIILACIRIGDAKKVTQVEMLPEEKLLIVLSSKILRADGFFM